MAIRRPPTTFSDTISTADIADDAITGGKLANDIAISTTGNIATTGSGTLTVAGNTTLSGTNNLGSNPTVTLGSNATFPAGHVIQCVQETDDTKIYSTTNGEILIQKSITPKHNTSKFFITFAGFFGSTNPNGGLALLRNSTAVGASADQYSTTYGSFISADEFIITDNENVHLAFFGWSYIDSPNTSEASSAITYKIISDSPTHFYFNRAKDNPGNSGANSTLTIMEIAQ